MRWLLLGFAALAALIASIFAAPSCLGQVFYRVVKLGGGPQALNSALILLSRLHLPWYAPFKDEDTLICEASALYEEHYKVINVRTAALDRAYVDACKRVLPSLDAGARAELNWRLAAGILNYALSVQEQLFPRFAVPFQECTAPWEYMSEDELEENGRAIYNLVGAPPLRIRHAPHGAIGEAFARGEPLRFDAKGLIPDRFFNASLRDLHMLHGDRKIAFHGLNFVGKGYEGYDCYSSLAFLTRVLATSGPGTLLDVLAKHAFVPWVLQSYCQDHLRFGDVALSSAGWRERQVRFSDFSEQRAAESNEYVGLFLTQQGLMDGNVNVRRFPNWARGELDEQKLAERIGLMGQVELAHNLLWFGATPGGAHADMQDNLLVQLAGEVVVFVVPSNCSGPWDVANGPQATAEWLMGQGRNAPYFVVPLRPGDGLALPSGAVHLVLSKDPRRVTMNFFLEPKYGQMRWDGLPANFYATADNGFLAMRSLWLKTIRELWDTGAAGTEGFAIHGQRQELV